VILLPAKIWLYTRVAGETCHPHSPVFASAFGTISDLGPLHHKWLAYKVYVDSADHWLTGSEVTEDTSNYLHDICL
jgi:hypothetical protein